MRECINEAVFTCDICQNKHLMNDYTREQSLDMVIPNEWIYFSFADICDKHEVEVRKDVRAHKTSIYVDGELFAISDGLGKEYVKA